MKNIKIISTNDVDNTNIEGQNLEIYKLDKNKSDENELKKTVIDINKSQNEFVYLITNKEDLFEFFNRNIICEKMTNDKFGFESEFFNVDIKNITNEFKISLEQNLENNLYFIIKEYNEIKNIFIRNIEQVLNNYGSVFQIDIKRLVKNTAYKVNSKDELINLINEDLNLISFKQIITSRLCIIFYRLTYFDLDASKASIGRIFTNIFGESESFKINLNRNPNGWFFTDLNNKIFRGYKINSLPTLSTLPINNESDLKIKIAKKLLSNNIKLKIVAEAIEMKEEELKNFIYGNNSSSLNINNNFRISPNFGQQFPREC